MKHVLVVEDDSFLNKMLSYNLTADGYDITSVLNARTAKKAISSKTSFLLFPLTTLLLFSNSAKQAIWIINSLFKLTRLSL